MSAVLVPELEMGLGGALNMPLKNGVSVWCGLAAGGDML